MFGFLIKTDEEARRMQELREAIAKYGQGIGQDIVKVDMFLNHRIETGLLFRMGEELADRFRDAKPDLILTVEASGIALALAVARAMNDLPVVFAKKGATVVQSPDVAEAKVYSFTHKRENVIRVDKKFLPQGSRVLIIDDFLADGQACQGMMALCAQTDCPVVGIGIGIEKGFMQGGKNLRAMGIPLTSLAVVTGIEDGKILLADD
jgi:xanthine phosphoribosyltransferase